MAADLLLGLGAAVVKVACKVWLKDSTFASDASAEVIDVVKGKLTGELEQRDARRLFEDLEVPVAKKLEGLRRDEFRGMPENEWNAAVLAVGDTLRRAQFSDADIFEGDLDPLYLRRQVAVATPTATRDLSEAGGALYARLLTECCAYVVELTSTLPRFNPGAFGEILRRQSRIIQQVTEILNLMPSPGAIPAGEGQAEEDFAAAYRRQVVSQLDRLELFGVTVSDSVRGYALSTAYIPLSVSGPVAGSLQVLIDSLDELTSTAVDVEAGRAERTSSSMRINEVLANTSRLFLRGEAGSGKTTLLQWLAVRSARRDFPKQLSAWNGTIPFLIRLRRSVGKELPPPEDFVTEVGRHVAGEMPRGWAHRLLREGRALVLVDGLDELPEAQRRTAREWLTSLVDAFPDAKYVVTSRPGAASSAWLDRQGFDAAEVEPMGWPDVQEFVRHWHGAFRAESIDQGRLDEVAASETALLESLYARHHLRMLATSPLLCALLCALNLDRRAQLPSDRMELYAIALDMLLERRDLERQIPASGPQLSRTRKTFLLEDLAYWLIRNGWSDAPKERAAERIGRRLAEMPGVMTDDGAAVLNALMLRSGLIREPVVGRIDFVHRTFEEYLAALAAVNDDQCGELIRNAHDDQWREVIVMAVGHARLRQRGELLSGVLDRAEGKPRHRQKLQTLAVTCLETSSQLDPDLHARVQKIAESLLPPRGVRQAETLARMGEPLLDLLAARPPRGLRQAAATIRAASVVGGPIALPIIARCAKTPGISVRNELRRAWMLFDVEEYATRVLSGSPHAARVYVDDPTQLAGLSAIKGLRDLVINFPDWDGDLNFVHVLPTLETLIISGDQASLDISPLQGSSSLRGFYIDTFDVEVDFSSISSIPGLQEVGFHVGSVLNPESLRDCSGLKSVAIVGLRDISRIDWYIPGRSLENLTISKSPLTSISQVPDIPEMRNIRSLTFVGCQRLRSAQGVDRWAETLEGLSFAGCSGISDIQEIVRLPNLSFLNIGRTGIRDLSAIRRLPNLRRLVLGGDREVDLSGLEGVKSLTVLVFRGQRVCGTELLGEGSRVVRS